MRNAIVLLAAIGMAVGWPPFGLMALSIILVAGWWFWPAAKAYLWTDTLPPPEE